MTKKDDFEKLWERIKSKDFKDFILNCYDFDKLDCNTLKNLILSHYERFNLRIKI